jgi:hypothetical protein
VRQNRKGENIWAQEGGEDSIMKACIILNFTRQNQDEQIKEDEMGGAYSTDVETRYAYRDVVGKPESKRPLGRPKRR